MRLNVPGRDPIVLHLPDERDVVQQLAMRWSYSLRNRERWARRSDLLQDHRKEIQEVARYVGVTDDALQAIAAADLVEVEIPYRDEEHDWELRIMPWEYLLATTSQRRSATPLTVVRCLRSSPGPRGALRPPRKWFYVESAPGRLRETYEFGRERKLVQESAGSARARTEKPLLDPDGVELAALLGRVGDGDVVHFAGFDPHQGLRLLDDPSADEVLDGYLVRASRGSQPLPAGGETAPPSPSSRAEPVGAEKLAELITSGGRRSPRLVAFNLQHSAARTAALAVARGAEAAIGFQDSFDDSLAEVFFATFYHAWRLSNWNTVAAFRHAWHLLREQQQPLHGSGLVLWSRRSIRETLPGYWGEGLKLEAEEINQRWARRIKSDRVALSAANVRDHLEVAIKPLAALNYSELHNGGSLFEYFTIRKTSVAVGRVQDLHVSVELHVGTESHPYRATVELGEQLRQLDLRHAIHVSLTSSLSRALRESVQTSLFVEVLWRDTVLQRETFPIALLPTDEWIDTDANRIWLPSFVLPRDPAVARVITHAQRYLMAIADDPAMGFSGYQSVDSDAPDAAPEVRCEGVDAQVRALWSALLYELPLSYINPPPVFSDYSQRLRTPSDVIDGGRGTCIDLALLLASCLEYVEIYPVIFLLTDHAFPGYWRDEAYYDAFVSALPGRAAEDGGDSGTARRVRAGQRFSWYLERAHFREVLAEVHAGRLVPLETVALTEHVGFASALEQGKGNLTSRRQFQAMLDIISARWDEWHRVTPLPVIPS